MAVVKEFLNYLFQNTGKSIGRPSLTSSARADLTLVGASRSNSSGVKTCQ
jgi:hypothetical protein